MKIGHKVDHIDGIADKKSLGAGYGLHDFVRNVLLEGVRNVLLENGRKILMENVRKQSYMVENVRNLLDFVRNLFFTFLGINNADIAKLRRLSLLKLLKLQ